MIKKLTEREKDLLALFKEGVLKQKDQAEALGVSVALIKAYSLRLYWHFNVTCKAELIYKLLTKGEKNEV